MNLGVTVKWSALAAGLQLVLSCSTPVTESPSCKIIVVAPIYHADELVSDAVTESWIDAQSKNLKNPKKNRGCYQILRLHESKAAMHFVHVDNMTNLDTEPLTHAQMKGLVEQTDADYVAVLTYVQSENLFRLQAKISDLKTFFREDIPVFQSEHKVQVSPKALGKSANSPLKYRAFNLIPNAIAWSEPGSKEIVNDREDDKDVYLRERISSKTLPQIISGISLLSLEHPKGFNTLDTAFRVYPNITFYYLNDRYKYSFFDSEKKPLPETFDYNVLFYGTVVTMLGEFSFYSPLGTLFFNLGGGGGIFKIKDNFSDVYGFASVVAFGFGYRSFFFTDHFFLSISMINEHFQPRLIENPVFKSSDTKYFVGGWGYFFPDMKTHARKAMD
jgi:hypothetical protein